MTVPPAAPGLVAGPRHAPLRRGLQLPAADRADLLLLTSPRHALADAVDLTPPITAAQLTGAVRPGEPAPSPDGPAAPVQTPALEPARKAFRSRPRLRLAYQVGVPVVGVAALMAVQAFTPASSAASEAGRGDDALTARAASVTPVAAATTRTAPGTNDDGSLPLSGSRVPGARLASTRSSVRPVIASTAELGTGDCPVGGSKGASCNQAIAFMVRQMTTQSHDWHSQCLALVGTAYGGIFQHVPRAIDAAMLVKAGGKLHTTDDLRSIPRGSLLWYASAPGQPNQAGHVAIAIGGGMAISNDAPFDDGRVGVVPINYFTVQWGKIFLGYSSPADSRNA